MRKFCTKSLAYLFSSETVYDLMDCFLVTVDCPEEILFHSLFSVPLLAPKSTRRFLGYLFESKKGLDHVQKIFIKISVCPIKFPE